MNLSSRTHLCCLSCRMSDFEFTDVSGQTLTKEPGSVNG